MSKPYRYSSVSSLCFTIQHNDKDGEDITDSMVIGALCQRIADMLRNNSESSPEIYEATVSELFDTQKNAPG